MFRVLFCVCVYVFFILVLFSFVVVVVVVVLFYDWGGGCQGFYYFLLFWMSKLNKSKSKLK